MNKKAYLKTVEVLLAILLGGAFIIYVIPSSLTRGIEQDPVDLLENLEYNNEFRQLMIFNQSNCIDAELLARSFLPARFKYSYAFSAVALDNINDIPESLPTDKRVYADTLFLAGNSSEYKPVVVKLFYWNE
ncbi:hypothetical protein KY311_00095 [Candidatus Woesearchaeota archaeon]|nr:hypothetical protein [Candidatus Woesearchaeota archaeon]MBW3017266.1 hypothetical protein [Candidatus Woesearchaeota archaeon]